MGFDDKAVIQFRQRKIIAVTDLRTVTGGGAKTGFGRMGAIDCHQQQLLPSRQIAGVAICLLQEVPVVNVQGGNVTGANADDSKGFCCRNDFAEVEILLFTSLRLPQGFAGSKQQWFERLRPVGPGKVTRVSGRTELVMAWRLLVAEALRQPVHRVDDIIVNAVVVKLWANTGIAILLQDINQTLQAGAQQEARFR